MVFQILFLTHVKVQLKKNIYKLFCVIRYGIEMSRTKRGSSEETFCQQTTVPLQQYRWWGPRFTLIGNNVSNTDHY